MTWLGLGTHQVQRFSPCGIGIDQNAAPIVGTSDLASMAQGTLLLEASLTELDRPERLLGFLSKAQPAQRGLEFRAVPGGGVSFVHSFGSEVRHLALQHASDPQVSKLRITYSWDMAHKWARLAVERPGSGELLYKSMSDPLPMLVKDMRNIVMKFAAFPEATVFAAVSNQILPIGPAPTIGQDNQIATGLGLRRAGDLQRGDTVIGPDGTSVPVLYPIRAHFPAVGSFRPVRLRAPYFGLRRDVVVAPTQNVLLTGSHVEYNFGREQVLVPAGYLVNGTAAHWEPSGPVVSYVQFLMPKAETLNVVGLPMQSINLGRMRRDATALLHTHYAQAPRANLPEHAPERVPVLNAFEAITLASERAA